MYKSKPILLLSALSSSDLRSFERFLRSPFFNRNEQLIALFTILKKEHPEMNSPNLDREKLYQKLFNSKDFNESKLRYIFSDLTKLIEKFIIISELDKEPATQQLQLLKFFRNNNLDKYFSSTYDDAVNTLNRSPVKDSDYFFNAYLMDEQWYAYSSLKRDKSLDKVLQNAANNLDNFYLSKRLKYLAEMLTRQNFLNSNYDMKLMAPLLEHLKNRDYSALPAIHIYYLVLLTLIEEHNEAHFHELIILLDQFKDSFSKEELRDLYFLAQNYCTKKINTGKEEYLRHFFSLSLILLSQELIFENNFIIPSAFKNIVTVGLRLEEFDWTENFIYGFKDKLHPKFRENAFTYNLAWLHFFKGEFKKTLRLLNNVEYMDVYYILDSKILLLKTYYELEEIDAFHSLADSFYVYLRRNELISSYQKNICLNFVKFVKRLMKAKLGDQKAASGLRSELNTATQVAGIAWLIKKCEAL
jgi:hypothetical protein